MDECVILRCKVWRRNLFTKARLLTMQNFITLWQRKVSFSNKENLEGYYSLNKDGDGCRVSENSRNQKTDQNTRAHVVYKVGNGRVKNFLPISIRFTPFEIFLNSRSQQIFTEREIVNWHAINATDAIDAIDGSGCQWHWIRISEKNKKNLRADELCHVELWESERLNVSINLSCFSSYKVATFLQFSVYGYIYTNCDLVNVTELPKLKKKFMKPEKVQGSSN